MQPDQGRGLEVGARRWGHGDPARGAVCSRRRALERLCDALGAGWTGPILITGEAGAGKTWLARRLVDSLPAGWPAERVEVTSALDALEFLRLIGRGLGLAMPDRLGAARGRIQAALQDAATDGRRWLLIVDDAHRGAPELWEELHALTDQLGRPDGFAAVIVLGRTELVRDLSTRHRNALATRLSLHLHLMPLDLDEARELLSLSGRAGDLTEPALEELHRDAQGNPARLLHIAATRFGTRRPGRDEPVARGQDPEAAGASRPSSSQAPQRLDQPAGPIPAPGSATPPEELGLARSPSLIPTRPPIRLEDGLVEVGWEGDLEAELGHADDAATEPADPAPIEPDPKEELIEDRYAALQAWTEWTRNRERSPEVGTPAGQSEPTLETMTTNPGAAPAEEPSTAPGASTAPPAAGARAEAPHDFAPYNQLFTRLRQSQQD